MKRSQTIRARLGALGASLAVLSCATVANAHPYASDITINNNVVQFYMNETGAVVTVTFEDNSVLNMGYLNKGPTNFTLGTHTSYQISATKMGSGSPTLYTTDSNFWNSWTSPRGVDVHKNPKNGATFGRIYVSHDANTAVRQWGIYALTPDMSTNAFPLMGTNAWARTTSTYGLFQQDCYYGNTYGPFKLTVGPDDNLYVTDYAWPAATVYQFGPSFESTNVVLAPVGENQGIAAGIHGDPMGVAIEGSTATGDLKIYTADPGLGAPAGMDGQYITGGWNNIFRYDINGSSLPYSNAPNWAVNLGLPGMNDNQWIDMCLNPADPAKVYGNIYRLNYSDGCIQVFDKATGARLYTSLHDDGSDIFFSCYSNIRVSPDGNYLASATVNNAIKLVNLVNGIPDETSLITIANTPTAGNFRGIAWDAADNLYAISSGQALLRAYSLGITTTCVTSNDSTGTNGTFRLVVPDVKASIKTITPLASQNYINNTNNPGTPIQGDIQITLNKGSLNQAVMVNFSRTGTATLGNQYTMNLGTDASGITIGTNSPTTGYVIFPAYPAQAPGGVWSTDIKIIPTANPLTGPTTTAILTMNGGTNYIVNPPSVATVAIANTGPQLLTLSLPSSGASMNRGIPGDYAQFIVTRTGDTNGPNNTVGNVTPLTYTVSTIDYVGTAGYKSDYMAGAQNLGGGVPNDALSSITIKPGDVAVNCLIGDPVAHSDIVAKPVTVTATIALTNAAPPTGSYSTNCVSVEGYPYNVVATNAVNMNELDNRVGTEVPAGMLWSDPLTSAGASRNWTITYTDAGRGNNTLLPAVVPNYVNGTSESQNGGTNDFDVQFGYDPKNDGVPYSPVMLASNWTTALRMTVNKSSAYNPAAVNALAAGKHFSGNYALRFDMYLSIYPGAFSNSYNGTLAKEFAIFGVGHYGTNCSWRPATPIAAGAGCGPTNCDGVWFAMDADCQSTTPADFDGFASPGLPNSGTGDLQSNAGSAEAGVFKHPPFPFTRLGNNGALINGQPVNKWVSVSVEVTANTNVNWYIDGNKILTSFANTNGGFCTNGTIMLGYLDPVGDVGDPASQFVYFSNLRVVELSPYINMQPTPSPVLLMKGSTLVLSNSASLGTPYITNAWYTGSVAANNLVQTDTNNASSITSVLTVNNIQTGANYLAVVSDTNGAITNLASAVEVVTPLTNATVNVGAKFTTGLTVSGTAAPTYQWKFNGNNLANNTHYAGVTAGVLWITNVQPADAGTYSVAAANAAGTVTPSMVLTVVAAPSGLAVTPASQSKNWGSMATFSVSTTSGTAPFTYTWKKNGVNLTDAKEVSGSATSTLTLGPLTNSDAATYTVTVANSAGSATSVNTQGVLTITVPPPTLSGVTFSGGNAVLAFSSTNGFDTTGAFTLQCSPNVQGPYTNTTGSFSTSGNGLFQVTVPQTTDGSMFYRLQHAN